MSYNPTEFVCVDEYDEEDKARYDYYLENPELTPVPSNLSTIEEDDVPF